LIDVAAESGANAVKFQLFQAETLYPDGGELYDVFKSVELNPDWVPLLSDYANSHNLHFTASAFDITSLNILESNNVPFHKVASS
jgi:sialic acid synthase SpsE